MVLLPVISGAFACLAWRKYLFTVEELPAVVEELPVTVEELPVLTRSAPFQLLSIRISEVSGLTPNSGS